MIHRNKQTAVTLSALQRVFVFKRCLMWPEETGKLFDAVGSEAKEPPLRREVDAVQVEDHVDGPANTKRVVIPKKRRQHDVIQAFLKHHLQSKGRRLLVQVHHTLAQKVVLGAIPLTPHGRTGLQEDPLSSRVAIRR